jgi:hypothetical protein
MYKSVGYKVDSRAFVDKRRRLNVGNFCFEWCNGFPADTCQLVHPDCGMGSATSPDVVAYEGDADQCEDEILKIDQALDLVGDAMESSCQALVSTRTFDCIVQK